MQNYKKYIVFLYLLVCVFGISAQVEQPKKPEPPKAPTIQNVKAADLSALNTLSVKEKIPASSLNGLNNANTTSLLTSLLNGGSTQNINTNANVLLDQILSKLGEIQQNIAEITNDTQAKKTSYIADKTAKILRFNVNNYNVLDTCRTIYFSKKTKEGGFLLTADRKYISDGKPRDETFYLLFKKNNLHQFDVACSVSQDYENVYSFLYQLSQKQNLTAVQTGNFITLRVNDNDWKMDLLIDISELETL